MFSHRRYWILVAPVLVTSLSGCGVWDAWRTRMSFHDDSLAACNDESNPYVGIQPGHSTDPDSYNSDYLPYSEAPAEFGPTEQVSPPPVPPSSADQAAAALQPTPDSENRLIKTLKSPRIFAPDSVRSIYDRIIGTEAEEPATPKPSGPIAQNHIHESPTRACLYSPEDETELGDVGPVELGLPETEVTPESWERKPPQEISESSSPSGPSNRFPSVMQAGPSSYRHPLLADPTGLPYGR